MKVQRETVFNHRWWWCWYCVSGTLWNLSSHEPLKMIVINHGLQTLTDEIIIPHSGLRGDPNDPARPGHPEWNTVFKNTSGCLRWFFCQMSFPLRWVFLSDCLVFTGTWVQTELKLDRDWENVTDSWTLCCTRFTPPSQRETSITKYEFLFPSSGDLMEYSFSLRCFTSLLRHFLRTHMRLSIYSQR